MRVIAPSSPYWAKGVAQHNNLGQPHQGIVAALGFLWPCAKPTLQQLCLR